MIIETKYVKNFGPIDLLGVSGGPTPCSFLAAEGLPSKN